MSRCDKWADGEHLFIRYPLDPYRPAASAIKRCDCGVEVRQGDPRIVHAVWPGNIKETVCEHEFTMFSRERETWAPAKGDTLITCRACRDILHLPPL